MTSPARDGGLEFVSGTGGGSGSRPSADGPDDSIASSAAMAGAAASALELPYGDTVPESMDEEQDRLLVDRYSGWAKSYDEAFRDYSVVTLNEAVRLLGSPFPRRVLDVACGTGLLIDRLLRTSPDLECIGVDVSEAMLEQAKSRFGAHGQRTARKGTSGPNVRLLHGRAEHLPIANHAVDAVCIANAFHLVRGQREALAECRRVLVPGGKLVIVDWCRDALPMRLLALGLALTQRLRRNIVSLKRQVATLEAAGFEVEDARRFTARPLWGLMAIRARNPI